MAMYNMVGCNTNRTQSGGGVMLKAGQFRGYKPGVKLQNTTIVNDTIIFNNTNRNTYCQPMTYSTCPPPTCQNSGGGLLAALTGFAQLLGSLFQKDEPDGKGGPEKVDTQPKAEEPKKPPEEEVVDEAPIDAKAKEFFDFKLEEQKGKATTIGYKVEYGDNPCNIVLAKYGVDFGSPEYKTILKAMLDASGYEQGTNLKVGDTFTLPEVSINGKTYKPDADAKVQKGTDFADRKLGSLKKYETVYSGGGYYVVDNTDTSNPKRVTGLLDKETATTKMTALEAEAKKQGKIQRE